MTGSPSGLRFAVMSMMALGVFAILFSLGTWQVRRLAWKENLIETMQSRVHQPPVVLDALTSLGEGAEYLPVTAKGTFLHAAERHFFATHDGQSGYFIYTPLETAPGMFVFVNRGFVPFDRKNPTTRAEGQVGGNVKVTGLARTILTAKPSWLVPDNEPAKNIFYWKDFAAMRGSAGLPDGAKVTEVFVDADASPNPGGLPIGGVTIRDLANSHLQYAVTWYGLAATLAVIWSVLAWRHSRQRRLT